MTIVIAVGYQFDYVFDWTILKYPQIGSSSRTRVCNSNTAKIIFTFAVHSILRTFLYYYFFPLFQPAAKPAINPGPSAERVERPSGLLFSFSL